MRLRNRFPEISRPLMDDKKKRFVIEFSGEATLVGQLSDEWNLDECLSMYVGAVFDRGNTKEIKFP